MLTEQLESETLKAMGDNNKDKTGARYVKGVVEGQNICQTCDANWLCVNNMYGHLHRPNFYDIGGTYIEDLPSFWFLYKTEQVSKIYLVHLFVCNRQEGTFSVSVCDSNIITIKDCPNSIYLGSVSKVFTFENLPDSCYNYLTTYSFNEFDVELMKDKKLYISVAFDNISTNIKDITMAKIHDFRDLLSDPVGADFTMVSADGTKFPVHKFLLAARSEVFKAMLRDNTAESINNTVIIDDVTEEDLGYLIEFIYTGTVTDVENKNCFNLLILGDRYDIQGLKELAQYVLIQLINIDTALDCLIAGDMYNSATLKTAAMKCIKANISSLDGSFFTEINNVQLLQELCKYLGTRY